MHGEDVNITDISYRSSTNMSHPCDEGASTHGGDDDVRGPTPLNPYVEMVTDAFSEAGDGPGVEADQEPNRDARRFYDMLESAKQPIYDGCKEGQSPLSLASRLMSMKTDYNVAESCMDSFCQTLRDYLPKGNCAPQSYYETKDMLKEFAMPYKKIDVCKNSCMLYWGVDENLPQCKFCGENRFRPRKSTVRKFVSYKKMFYMPIAPRLKRM